MKVKINNEETTLVPGTTLADVAAQHSLPERGVAVAVNNAMVPRPEWAARELRDGDDIVILKAFCGG